MTRPIKFRAWWKAAALMVDVECIRRNGSIEFFVDSRQGEVTERVLQVLDEETQYDLMQFTGLTDRDGTDIYEGDILENGGDPLAVRYGEISVDGFADYTEKAVGFCLGGANYGNPHPELKVIGNVHQNGDLLNGTSL